MSDSPTVGILLIELERPQEIEDLRKWVGMWRSDYRKNVPSFNVRDDKLRVALAALEEAAREK